MTEVKNAGVSLVPMKRNLGGFLWDKDKSQSARVGNISVGEKIVELRLYLFEKRAFGMILSTKNELGWLFNLRFLSSGTKCCAIITKHGAVLYVDQHELPEIDHLNLVKIRPFYEFFNDIASLNTQLRGNDKVIMTDKTCAGVEKVIDKNHILEEEYSFISSRKATPTKMECTRIRKCYLRDGVAISTFLAWLDNKLNSDDKCVDIYEAKCQLDYYRKLKENFEISETSFIQRPSLNSPQSNSISRRIQLDNTIYINSSGQYNNCITRFIGTYHFKNPSALDKQRYTRVLQAHIAIDTLVFPRGTTGDIVDTIGRQALWKEGLDGDSSFIKNLYGENMDCIPLTAGMLLSNEPSSVFCVKNTVLVKQIDTPLCKNSHSLGFQHISFVPLCRRLIEVSLLSPEEHYWINSYHKECFDHLSLQMDDKALAWLMKETCPI